MTTPDRRVNDLGGLAAGPVDRHEHANTLFEKRVDAMFSLLSQQPIRAFTSDALRRSIEASTAEDYATRGYYEKWLYAIRDMLIEQDVVDRGELEARIARLAATETSS
jgi:hypothetical protein